MWFKTSECLPLENNTVDTKIDDIDGIRNEQRLQRRKNLWWTEDGKMYVYYTPTHWKKISNL